MEQVSNTSKAIKGMSSQTVVTITVGIVEIVSFSIMSRLLNQEDFGYYAAIAAITTVFASFSETGIGSAIIQKQEIDSHFINNAFSLSLFFGTFLTALLMILSKPLSVAVADETMALPLIMMSLTLLLYCLTSVNISIMQRKLQFFRVGMVNLFSQVLSTIVAILFALGGYGYYSIIIKSVLASILIWVLTLVLCKTKFRIELNKNVLKGIFSYSGWLMASVFFRNIAHQVDKLLMPKLLSVSALGAYNRPKDFVEQLSGRVNGIFDTALFPVLSSIQSNVKSLQSAFFRAIYLMNIFALLLTLAFVFNSSLIIRVFFGEDWLYLESAMMIVSCAIIIDMDGRLADCYLRSLALTKEQFYFRVIEAVLKIIGIVIGYRWGIVGIAISYVLTNCIIKAIKILYVGHKIFITPKQVLGTILSSWRYALLLLPILISSCLFLPDSIFGNILMLIIFITAVVVIFVFMPSLVGEQYKSDIHIKIVNLFNCSIKKILK